jgi:hypothetical protein
MPEVQQKQIAEMSVALAHEAKAVNHVKRHQRFTVVIGNPPYSGISANMTEYAQRIVDAYKIVDGAALNERKLWLQDDYVQFIRKAQTTIDSTNPSSPAWADFGGILFDGQSRSSAA